MANSVKEALQEAITELLGKAYVQNVEYQPNSDEDKPCGYVAKLLNVKHTVPSGGSTFSHKIVYIKKTTPFTYDWHYGGPQLEPASEPTKAFFESKLTEIKTDLRLDIVEISQVKESNESAILIGYKATAGDDADTYTIKAVKTGTDTYKKKVIGKKIVT